MNNALKKRSLHQQTADALYEARGETRLAVALLHSAEAECDRLKAGLEAIGTHCTSFTGPSTCIENGRTRDAEYMFDRWCDGCIARDALGQVATS